MSEVWHMASSYTLLYFWVMQCQSAQTQKPVTILSLMLLQNGFPVNKLDFTAVSRGWYVAPHCKHTLSWLPLMCTEKEMAHVQARCGYYCCGCTTVVRRVILLLEKVLYEWITPLSWQTLWYLGAQKMTKSCKTSTWWCGSSHIITQ